MVSSVSFLADHVEIGNGYGVPGGGAYYASSRPGLDSESEQKSATKQLPEFLKQKLKARGLLKDDTVKSHPLRTDNASFSWSLSLLFLSFLLLPIAFPPYLFFYLAIFNILEILKFLFIFSFQSIILVLLHIAS